MTRTVSAPANETPDACKARIQSLYERGARLRISMALTHSKVVQDAEVTITGVYKHLFCVQEVNPSPQQNHTFTYTDLITRRIAIQEIS